MELLLPLSVDPPVQEEPDPMVASASSSSRLSNLTSSSSRRFRHVSPPPSSSRSSPQRKGLGTGQPQLLPHKPNYSEIYHNSVTASTSSSLVIPNDEVHRPPAHRNVAVTQVYKVIRGFFLLWKWFCFGYFCVAILNKLNQLAVDWRTSRPVKLQGVLNNPESILSTLPLEIRLSKLSSLYPTPLSLKPFLLGPRGQTNEIAACLWTNESGLSLVQDWASSWTGPISLLVTHAAPPSSIAYKELFSRLVSLSQIVPNISFHIQHTPSSLRNFNAYVNLARLFSPSSKVLLFPPSALTIWGSLPRSAAILLNMRGPREQLIIPMLSLGLSNVSSVDMSRNTFLLTSALLLDKENAPWCTERLFTIGGETKEGGYQLASNIEIAFHWRECVWNTWLRSHGKIQLLHDEGWADTGALPLPLQLDALPETVESNLRVRLARKQRSETCFLVAREMMALGHWFTGGPSQPEGATEESSGGRENNEANQTQTQSTQAKWLRNVCRETLERWGKELILD